MTWGVSRLGTALAVTSRNASAKNAPKTRAAPAVGSPMGAGALRHVIPFGRRGGALADAPLARGLSGAGRSGNWMDEG